MLSLFGTVRRFFKMKKKPTIFDPTVGDDRTVLVRPITDIERCQYCGGDFENQYYILAHVKEGTKEIIAGGPERAFQEAKERYTTPHWVH